MKRQLTIQDVSDIHDRLRAQVILHRGILENGQQMLKGRPRYLNNPDTLDVDGLKDIHRALDIIDNWLGHLGRALHEKALSMGDVKVGYKDSIRGNLTIMLDEE